MWNMKKEACLRNEEIELLDRLPDNFPETIISPKDRAAIGAIYERVITPLERSKLYKYYELEMRVKWPGGERMKRHEAQRILLGWLIESQQGRKTMNDAEASEHFYGSLSNRVSWVQLLSLIYTRAQKQSSASDGKAA